MTETISSGLLQEIGTDLGEVNLFVHPPCLICGQFLGIKTEVVEVFGTDTEGKDVGVSSASLLQFLLKLFRIHAEQNNKDWNLNDEVALEVPFCHSCKQRLGMLMELQGKLDELSEQLQNGRDELKKCLERSEDSLEKEGVYQSDTRYYRIRRQILGRKVKERRKVLTPSRKLDRIPPVEVTAEERPPTRTSSRVAAKKANERLLEVDFRDSTSTTPFVQLSKADRKSAERWKRNFSYDEHAGEDKNQNQRDTNGECDNLEGVAATVPGSELEYDENPDFDLNSNISSDPDFVAEPVPKRKKEQRKKKITKRASHKKSKMDGQDDDGSQPTTHQRSQPGPRRKEVPFKINSITSEMNVPKPEENDGHQNPFASTPKRKSRVEMKITQNQDEDFIPQEDEANDKAPSSSDSEEELNSEDLESDTEDRPLKKRRPKRYKYHIDKSTGNFTFKNVLLEKLPNNEMGRECYKCTLCSRILEIRGKYKKECMRKHVIATHGNKSKKVYNKHRVDATTGNITYINVTLEKLPNNEFGKEEYKCTICSQILAHNGNLDKLKRHILENHTDFYERFKCRQCERKFKSSKSLLCHVESTHDKSLAHCPICGKPFTYSTAVARHRKSHLGEEEKQQLRLKKKGSQNDSGSEQQRQSSSSSLQCEHCGRICSSRKQMQDHYIRVHGTEEEKAKLKQHLCPECGKYVSNLKLHTETIHSTFRNYPCLLCDKRFKTARCLRSHKMIIHGNDAPFKCTLCTKTFFTKYSLGSHTKVHLNIREFQCEHCPSAFTRSAHLQRHNRIYHEEGSTPKRGTFIRGIKKKGVEFLTKAESPTENCDASV